MRPRPSYSNPPARRAAMLLGLTRAVLSLAAERPRIESSLDLRWRRESFLTPAATTGADRSYAFPTGGAST